MQTRRDLISQLIQLRRKRGLTQRRLGELSGLPQQQLSMVERERIEPRIDTLLALASALRARIVLVPLEEVDVLTGPLAGMGEDLPNLTGVSDLIVLDEESGD